MSPSFLFTGVVLCPGPHGMASSAAAAGVAPTMLCAEAQSVEAAAQGCPAAWF